MLKLQNNPYRIPLVYGFYGALLGISFYTTLLILGKNPWGAASWLVFWIPGVVAFFTIKQIQLENEALSFPFSAVFKIAMIAVFIQAALYNVLALLLGSMYGDDSLLVYQEEFVANAEQIKSFIGEVKYETLLDELKESSIISLTFSDFINKIIGGAIVSLILAGILKKNELLKKS